MTLCARRPASDRAHYLGKKSTADEMRAEFAVDAGEPLPDFSMMPLPKLLELGKYATPPPARWAWSRSSGPGGMLVLGGCTAFVDCPTTRCSMPIRAQPELAADPKVLKTIVVEADRCLGAYATVTSGGDARVGDAVTFTPPASSRMGDRARARAAGLKRRLIRAALPK